MLPVRSESMSVASLSPAASATPPSKGLWARVRRLDPVVSVATILLAAATYVPSFLTRPGMVADDSKQYLYLDPGKLIQSAISMWDPDVGMGTVTHQNIGFLFPMGPYYWIIQELHIPMWVGQRFWMGSLFFFAGTGVFFLAKLLGLSPGGRVAAGVAYTFTPFVIDYIARISAIVMPWAALGWMIGLVILAVRRGGWRYPALFAVVIALVGGVNATSILLAGLAPVLWIFYAVFVTKEVSARRALAAVLRLGVLSVGVSLWWIAGLWAEGVYGLNILKFTESIPTVTSTSLSSEVVRGLGYWYFYGQDKLQPWTSAGVPYMQSSWLIGVSFAVPAFCVIVGALARWRYRAFAVGLIFFGVIAAVAAYPFTDPSPLGKALRAAGSDSTIGLAMRSTNRIVPLIVLGFALLLGAGISAIAAVRLKTGLLVLVVAVALAAADLPPLWTGTLVASNLDRPEQLPSYVLAAAKYLNTHGTGRVLGIPGEDFAYYRWGVTGDPVWPGLIKRPYVSRQVVPQGEPASVDLLQALDQSIQDGVFVPSTLVPIARLMSASDILFQGNEQYERFNTARPQPLWLTLIDKSTGLAPPVSFGKPTIYRATTYPLQDETQLAIPTGASVPPPVAVFAVSDARPLARTETTSEPLLVAGSGAGLVNASAAGLLDGHPTIFYAQSFAHDTAGLDELLNSGAVLVLTDTNQKQQDTWGTLDDDTGYVEQAGSGPLVVDPNEQALPPVSGAGTSSQTVTTLSNVVSIRASTYGNPITNTPEDRAYNAFDQNPDTRWAEGAFGPATDAQLQVTLDKPVTTSEIRLLQPQTGPRNRWITRVSLTFNGDRTVTRPLGRSSRLEPGGEVHFPTQTFKQLTITVDTTSSGIRRSYNGFSGVGFADVTIPGVAPVVQTLRMPTQLLKAVGKTSITHPLIILMNRIRTATVPPRSDPELDMNRSFSIPTARTFSIGGAVRIAATDPDPVINQIVDRTPVNVSGPQAEAAPVAEVVFANSSGRLPGDLNASAYAAIDGNPQTSWMPGFGPQNGTWLLYAFDRPVTFDNLNLQVVTDGRHSIPTEITITSGLTSRVIKLPAIPDGKGRPQGSTTTVPVTFPAITGQQIQITIDKTRAVKELDYYSSSDQTDPIGIAEVGIPGVDAPPTPATTTSACLDDLLAIDGTPVDVQVSGSTATALSSGALQLSGCGNSAGGVTLGPGEHMVQTATSKAEGLDLDSIWLSSANGGSALPLTSTGTISLPTPPTSATARVLHQDRTHVMVKVTGTGTPYWLVLGQSQSAGWKASIQGAANLGSSTLIDGYANGWLISGTEASGTRVFDLSWTPQKVVDLAIIASATTLVGSIGIIVIPTSIFAWAWTGSRRLLRRRHVAWRRHPDSTSDKPVSEEESAPSPSVFASAWAGTSRILQWPAARWRRRSESATSTAANEDETTESTDQEESKSPVSVFASAWAGTGRLLQWPAARWRRRSESAASEPTVADETTESTDQEESKSPVSVFASAWAGTGRLLHWPVARWRRRSESAASDPTVADDATRSNQSDTETDAVESLALIPRSHLQALVPAEPELTSILSTRGQRPHVLFMLVVAVLSGAAAGAVSAPIAAPIVFGAVVLGCLVPWSRLLFVLAPFGLLGATGVYMVVQQQRHRYLSNIGWPEQFPVANTLAWIAMCALLAGAVVEIARWRSWLAGEPFKPPVVQLDEAAITETPSVGPGPTEQTDEVVTEPSTQVGPAPADGQSEGEPELVPASTHEASTSADTDESQVKDQETAVPADGEDGPVRKKGPLRSAFRRSARWLKSLLPGTLSSRAEVPNGGEPPSDDA
jgi:hypothetical protein